MRTRAERRHLNVTKALRKRNMACFEWYDNLHQYSKNKIHCSCPLCSCKTKIGAGGWKCKGRHKGYNWSHMDLKRIVAMEYDENEFIRKVGVAGACALD